jgi:hypothetical protein
MAIRVRQALYRWIQAGGMAQRSDRPRRGWRHCASALSLEYVRRHLGRRSRPRSDRVACDRAKEPPPIREAAFASLQAPLRPVLAPVDPTDASEEREASGR